jgi:succinate dehydrogenase / fumarate reductase iron-sulfur subunit
VSQLEAAPFSSTTVLRVFRGDPDGGAEQRFEVPVQEGMVVLDAIHHIQANFATDLACRWNCKAAKCGSCSAEINGRPRLMCKTRIDEFEGEEIHVWPMKAFPLIKDLVTDVSWNYQVNRTIPAFTPRADEPVPFKMLPEDVERVYEYRKCIECFLCQDVCHVLREHHENSGYYGPRYMVRIAGLELHPLDTANRAPLLNGKAGVGMCNITKCCQEVCPEHIKITDNAIIPLKERLATEYHDPVVWVARKLRPKPAEELAELKPPERFGPQDVIRLRTGRRPLARVWRVLPDGRLQVWILAAEPGPQRWEGPKVVKPTDAIANYGPLDEVGIGSKLHEPL